MIYFFTLEYKLCYDCKWKVVNVNLVVEEHFFLFFVLLILMVFHLELQEFNQYSSRSLPIRKAKAHSI